MLNSSLIIDEVNKMAIYDFQGATLILTPTQQYQIYCTVLNQGSIYSSIWKCYGAALIFG